LWEMIVDGEMRLKGRAPVDTLCRGEVAEWLNAAVSKTVTSVIPASGVRIPPSPRFSTPPSAASQHAPASPPLVSMLRLTPSLVSPPLPSGRWLVSQSSRGASTNLVPDRLRQRVLVRDQAGPERQELTSEGQMPERADKARSAVLTSRRRRRAD
jgi:hypothetical protein